jgi:hypothetical protein
LRLAAPNTVLVKIEEVIGLGVACLIRSKRGESSKWPLLFTAFEVLPGVGDRPGKSGALAHWRLSAVRM